MYPPRIGNVRSFFSLFDFLIPHPHRCTLHPRLTSALPTTSIRQAHHAAEGAANRASRGPGKRLGAKKQATELVVPNSIIFRQRGTHWFPGENCNMGRDHTIYAKEKGYVVYYKDRWRNKLGYRKYIGVVFERGMQLPRPANAPRVRRLGFRSRDRPDMEVKEAGTAVIPGIVDGDGKEVNVETSPVPIAPTRAPKRIVKITDGYQVRESNASIGRVLDRENARKSKK